MNRPLLSVSVQLIGNIGIPDRFIAHGSQAEQWADCGLDVAGVIKQLKQLLS